MISETYRADIVGRIREARVYAKFHGRKHHRLTMWHVGMTLMLLLVAFGLMYTVFFATRSPETFEYEALSPEIRWALQGLAVGVVVLAFVLSLVRASAKATEHLMLYQRWIELRYGLEKHLLRCEASNNYDATLHDEGLYRIHANLLGHSVTPLDREPLRWAYLEVKQEVGEAFFFLGL